MHGVLAQQKSDQDKTVPWSPWKNINYSLVSLEFFMVNKYFKANKVLRKYCTPLCTDRAATLVRHEAYFEKKKRFKSSIFIFIPGEAFMECQRILNQIPLFSDVIELTDLTSSP